MEIGASSMCKVRAKLSLVTIGALGTIEMGLDQNSQLLPGQASAIQLQKITLVYAVPSIRKVLR
jgi:hypothetical protein